MDKSLDSFKRYTAEIFRKCLIIPHVKPLTISAQRLLLFSFFEKNPNVLSDELKNHQPVTSLAWNPQGTLLLSCCASDTTMVTFMCPSAQLT